MKTVKSVEVQRNFSELSIKAIREPIAINKYNKPHLVILAYDTFIEMQSELEAFRKEAKK